jgi:cytochrome c551/c552
MTRRGIMPKKHREAVKQTTPTLKQLAEKYAAGFHSRKEIVRRVKAGLPNNPSEQVVTDFNALQTIAVAEGWITL